jgi:plastocyanin
VKTSTAIAFVAFLAAAGTAAIAVAAGHHTVVQKDKAFSAAELTVHVGDTVTFQNQDGIVHNVYSKTAGHEFNTRSQPPGSSKDVTFDSPGDVEVKCAIHPNMAITIHVK